MKKTLFLLAAFLFLASLAYFIPYFKWDVFIAKDFQSFNSQIFNQIMWLVTDIGNQPLMVFIVITVSLLLFISGLRREAIISSLSTAVAVLTGSLIKILVDRPRPTTSMIHVSVWLSDKSFPSDHVLAFTVFFGFLLYLIFKKSKLNFLNIILTIVFILLIATIGISRIYLGAHWPSDVLGGYLLGLVWLLITIKFYNSSHHGQR
jgi:membrane-associated phospholipid phosphatase